MESAKLAYSRFVIALLRGVKRVQAKPERDGYRFRE
jgi:hypothetical protein